MFINDTLDSLKQAIVLYDLKDNKIMSNYLEVDASLTTDSRYITKDSLDVIALSAKKNKYGIIRINSDSVKSVLEFANESISNVDNYYIVNKSSGTYLVYDADGKALTSEFAEEIVSFNQQLDEVMTVNNKNKYTLFTAKGVKLTNKAYDRIDIYQKYIVGLSGKSLDVLNHIGKDYCSNCANIALYTTDYNEAYSIDDNKVTIYNGNAIVNEVSLTEGDGYGEE